MTIDWDALRQAAGGRNRCEEKASTTSVTRYGVMYTN